jgi:hypothetical protein
MAAGRFVIGVRAAPKLASAKATLTQLKAALSALDASVKKTAKALPAKTSAPKNDDSEPSYGEN